MKYCPTCGTQYTDDTLRFCLQDGSKLDDLREAEIATVVLNETPTITRKRDTSRSYETTLDGAPKASENSSKRKRSWLMPAVVTLIVATALFIAGAGVTWIYLSKPKVDNGNKPSGGEVSPTRGNANETPSPHVSPAPSSSGTAVPTASQTAAPVDRGQVEREISNMIDRWASQAEDLDLNSYMQNYAQRVDYYNHKAADKAYVREDKGRAFKMYDSILIVPLNMKFSVDASGEAAIAEFDKSWDFRGERNSSGKVRTELRLRRDGGRWLITGERDIKVYYINR
jgi:hypothetical protein